MRSQGNWNDGDPTDSVNYAAVSLRGDEHLRRERL